LVFDSAKAGTLDGTRQDAPADVAVVVPGVRARRKDKLVRRGVSSGDLVLA
jgi:hypothetical protein